VLPSIPEVIKTNFETHPLCLPRTANAVCNLMQQEPTVLSPTSHPPRPPLPFSSNPRCLNVHPQHPFDIGCHVCSKTPASFPLVVTFFLSLASIPFFLSLCYNQLYRLYTTVPAAFVQPPNHQTQLSFSLLHQQVHQQPQSALKTEWLD
jgi:hypothetical protein